MVSILNRTLLLSSGVGARSDTSSAKIVWVCGSELGYLAVKEVVEKIEVHRTVRVRQLYAICLAVVLSYLPYGETGHLEGGLTNPQLIP